MYSLTTVLIKILKRTFCASKKVVEFRILNIFKTQYKKNALLVYITSPFNVIEPFDDVTNSNYEHTNFKESRYIARSLYLFHFNVDVIDYRSYPNFDFLKYDIIIGFGESLEQSFYKKTKINLVRIFYGTGQHPSHSNRLTVNEVFSFYELTGKWYAELSRVVPFTWPFQLSYCDILVALGNRLVGETYQKEIGLLENKSFCQIRVVRSFFHKGLELKPIDLKIKQSKAINNTFCWFGSSGIIHKGLFQVIKVMNRIKSEGVNLKLNICGMGEFEKLALHDAFGSLDFVYDLGKLNLSIKSDLAKLDEVSFNIFPSVSEGGAPSVINIGAICGIPSICGCGIGLDECVVGISMKSRSDDELYESIKKALTISSKEYILISNRIYNNILISYTEEEYLKSWQSIIGQF
jgi:glycosyltransferase involved in cell wall biosynthesis